MLKLFLKDNVTGVVREYGTDQHDSLVLQEDGSLHYENLQNCTGTMFPEEGYSFCLSDGTIPDLKHPEYDGYIDIGGCEPADLYVLLEADNTTSDIEAKGTFFTEEDAASELFSLMRKTLKVQLDRDLDISDGFELYEKDLEVTATKSGGTIYYCDSQDIVYWDIKSISYPKDNGQPVIEVPRELDAFDRDPEWDFSNMQFKVKEPFPAKRKMYFIKKSEWAQLEREHSDYCGKSLMDPSVHIIFEGSIPDNHGEGGTTLLFEGKHFQIIPDEDFVKRFVYDEDVQGNPGDKNEVKQINAEWFGYMKAYRLYDPHHSQQTIAWEDSLEQARKRLDAYYGQKVKLVECDSDTMHVETF